MIKVEDKTLAMTGTPNELMVEMLCIVNAVYLQFKEIMGEDCARQIFDAMLQSAYMTKEEMEDEIFRRMME